jgi:transposase-like protein
LPDSVLDISVWAMPNSLSFRYFKTSPEIIQLAVMLYVRFPLSLRNVEALLHERGVDVGYEFVRYWWHRFGSQFASQIKKRRVGGMQSSNWKWHFGWRLDVKNRFFKRPFQAQNRKSLFHEPE